MLPRETIWEVSSPPLEGGLVDGHWWSLVFQCRSAAEVEVWVLPSLIPCVISFIPGEPQALFSSFLEGTPTELSYRNLLTKQPAMLSLSSFSLALKIVKEKILLFTFTLYPILSGYYLILTPDVWVLQTSSNPVTPVQCSEMYCVCFFVFGWIPKHAGSYFSDQGSNLNPCPLQWKPSVLTAGLPGNPQCPVT